MTETRDEIPKDCALNRHRYETDTGQYLVTETIDGLEWLTVLSGHDWVCEIYDGRHVQIVDSGQLFGDGTVRQYFTTDVMPHDVGRLVDYSDE